MLMPALMTVLHIYEPYSLVLHTTAAFWPTQLTLLGIIPPTEATQRLVLWLGFYDSGTKYSARPASN
jgi:hypothetical protein